MPPKCKCCCDRCQVRTRCHECCRCMCQWLCVKVRTFGGEGNSSSPPGSDEDKECQCYRHKRIPFDCDQKKWSGTIDCGINGAITVDAEIKPVDGVCTMVVSSPQSTQESHIPLGDSTTDTSVGSGSGAISGGSCEVPTASGRLDLDNLAFSEWDGFEFEITGCARTSDVVKSRGCDPECGGCDCVCTCLCYLYTEANPNPPFGDCVLARTSGVVCRTKLSDDLCGWEFVVGGDAPFTTVTITICDNPDGGGCVLCVDKDIDTSVASASAVDSDTDTITPINCPWNLDGQVVSINRPNGSLGSILLSCQECECVIPNDDCPNCCPSLNTSDLCESRQKTLTAEVIDGCEAMLGIAVTLFPAATEPGECQVWSGQKSFTCDGPTTLGIELVCKDAPGNCETEGEPSCLNYTMSVSYTDNSGCATTEPNAGAPAGGECMCDPFQADFGAPAPVEALGPCSCCNGEPGITIRVTE